MFGNLSNHSSGSSGSVQIGAEMPFSSDSRVSSDVGAVEYVSAVDATEGLLKWNCRPPSVGVVGDATVDVRCVLGGEYGRSKRDVPIGDMSRLDAIAVTFSDYGER